MVQAACVREIIPSARINQETETRDIGPTFPWGLSNRKIDYTKNTTGDVSPSSRPSENGGSSWNFWELAIWERGELEVKDEKENMPLVDGVVIVAKVYIACQLRLRLWNTTLATQKLCGHKAYIGMYYCALYTIQEDMLLTSGGKG